MAASYGAVAVSSSVRVGTRSITGPCTTNGHGSPSWFQRDRHVVDQLHSLQTNTRFMVKVFCFVSK